MANRKLVVEIVGDSNSLQRALKGAASSSTGFGNSMAKMAKVVSVAALGAAGAITAGLVVTLKRGFDELSEGQQVAAQTAAALKSTGGAANVTAKDIDNLAQSISRKTAIDDEAVQASENMLLTFTSIRNEAGKNNDIFNQATQAVADLATRMNDGAVPSMEQLSTMSIKVGKALNDPVKGMTALGRVGVQFTAGQKEAIKAMVESGDTMGAQKLILAELTKEFGGSAKAAGETLPGQLAKARNAFDEIAANLAVKFLPMLTSILEWVNANWPTIAAVIDAVGTAIISTFNAIGAAVDYLRNQWEIHRESATRAWEAVRNAVMGVVTWFQTNVVPVIQGVINAAIAIWNNFGGEIQSIGGRIVATVKVFLQNMIAPFKIFFALLRGDWSAAWEELKGMVSRTLGAMVANIKAILSAAASTAGTLAAMIGKAILNGIASGLEGIANKVADGMQRVWDALRTAATTAYNFAKEIGSKIVSGIWDGFKGLIGDIKDKIGSAIGGIISGIDVPGFSPPFEAGKKGIGEKIGKGAIAGVEETAPELKKVTEASVRAAVGAGALAAATKQIGIKAVQDIIDGIVGKQPSLNQQFAAAVAQAMEAARQAVIAAKQGVVDAFAAVGSAALAAFDAVTAAGSPAMQRLKKLMDAEALARQMKSLNQAVADSKAAWETAKAATAAAATEYERMSGILSQLQAGVDISQIQGLTEEERQKLMGMTPEEAAAWITAQQTAAQTALTAAQKAESDALTAFEDAKYNLKVAKQEQTLAKLTAQWNAERAKKRGNLQDQLDDIEEFAKEHPKKWAAVHTKVMKLLNSYGLDYKKIGKMYGRELGEGIVDSIEALRDALDELAKLMKSKSPPKKGPLRDIDKWGRSLGKLFVDSFAQGITGAMGALRPALQMAEDYLGLTRKEAKTGDISTDTGGGGEGYPGKPDWADSDIWDAAVGMAMKAGQLSQLIANLTPFGSIASNARLLDLMHQNRGRYNWGPAQGRVKRFLDLMGPPEWLSGREVAQLFGLKKGGINLQEGWRYLHRRELVAPLDSAMGKRYLGGFGRVEVNIHGTVIGGRPDEIARALAPEIESALARRGSRNGGLAFT